MLLHNFYTTYIQRLKLFVQLFERFFNRIGLCFSASFHSLNLFIMSLLILIFAPITSVLCQI